MKFKPNGCTGVPDLDVGNCCDDHDKMYHDGVLPRHACDIIFFQCIVQKGKGKNIFKKIWYMFVGLYYWAGVRLFGKGSYKG